MSRMERLDRARAKLRALPKAVRAEIAAALQASAEQIAGTARSFAPRDSGDLARSIRVEDGSFVQKNANVRGVTIGKAQFAGDPDLVRYIVAGDDRAWYARLIEFGTKARTVRNWYGREGVAVPVGAGPAQPFMGPAYRTNKRQIRARIARATRKAAQDVAKG